MKKKTKLLVISIISLGALFNAFYLSYDWLFAVNDVLWGWNSFCNINDTFSCTTVLEHPLSQIYWIPFPVIALLVYPIIIIVALLWYFKNIVNHFKILFAMAIGWIMFNWYFIYQETFNIWAFCPLCLLCTAIIISIACMSWSEVRKECIKNKKK